MKKWILLLAIDLENVAFAVSEWTTSVRQRLEHDERESWLVNRLREVHRQSKRWPKFMREQRMKEGPKEKP